MNLNTISLLNRFPPPFKQGGGKLLRYGAFAAMLILLSSCGGGGSGGSNNASNGNNTNPSGGNNTNTPKTGLLRINGQVVSGVNYSNTANSSAAVSATGEFNYTDGDTIRFQFAGLTFGSLTPKPIMTESDLATGLCINSNVADCEYKVAKNLIVLAQSTDSDTAKAGYQLPNDLKNMPKLDTGLDTFAREMQALNYTVTPLFKPSLGINLEEPQPESDTVGGQPLPFADVFRVARPFREYSCADISYDKYGWPTNIPASCANGSNEFLRGATTGMLRNAPEGAIPEGQYTVLYEGNGTLKYSGMARLVSQSPGRDMISVSIADKSDSDKRSGIRLQITATDTSNPIKNIRIVIPGGICSSNPFQRVSKGSDCRNGDYQDFASQLAQDRNAIVFNPDFLAALKDFKVIRTMNFMKASPGHPTVSLLPNKDADDNIIYDEENKPVYTIPKPGNACYYKVTKDTTYTGEQNEAFWDCITQPFTWDMRAKMEDATWGASGNANSPLLMRYGRGAPLEVIIALANQLQADPWFNILHNADDDYIIQFAIQVRDTLDPKLKAYVEYSNETWNGIFWAAAYASRKGIEQRLSMLVNGTPIGWVSEDNYNEGWLRALYTAKRSKEIFALWQSVFGNTNRFVRVLGSYYADPFKTLRMLEFDNTASAIDAVAIAPYFRGCWKTTSNTACLNSSNVPKVLSDASSVDEVFDIIRNAKDPYGIDAVIKLIQEQQTMVAGKGKKLIAYEGGQHLAVDWSGEGTWDQATKDKHNALMALFQQANRDPRMGELYTQLLNGWKAAGGGLFVLYTLPQSFHKWGNWGIKEHLNKQRDDSPKYDAAMKFQETVKQPWW